MEDAMEKLWSEHEDSLKNSSSEWEQKYNRAVENHSKEITSLKKKSDEEM